MRKPAWGYHLVLDLANCSPSAIRSRPVIAAFSQRLVSDIRMVAYGSPQIVRFGVDDKMGYTLVQLIETSNITAHFCEETNDAYMDVFSCKPFDPRVVTRLVREVFQPQKVHSRMLRRDANELR